jgi:3'(2'), 5'-bisphosphate nucleotidase
MDLNTLCEISCDLALQAGLAILKIYNDPEKYSVQYKSNDSPLTIADTIANKIICDGLKNAAPDIPIISEENKQTEWDIRKNWDYVWLVDPLDGTKEFIKHNGDFTVNIALVKDGVPILGVVYIPVTNELYWAYTGSGAWKGCSSDRARQINVSQFALDSVGIRIVSSRSHCNDETKKYISRYCEPELVSRGSSIKLLMVAEGIADIYPRIAPTMEWDTAAADIIVREAGGKVLQYGTEHSIVYNKQNLLNPYFIVCGQDISLD